MPIQQEYEAARKANEQRYAEAMQIYDEIISRYRPGGQFQKAQLGELEKRKVRDVGAETQQLISSGMFGTTTTAGLPGKWEAEVGAPSRLKLEDIMMQRLSTAQVGKAGFMERREDVYPDVGAYAGYAGQEAAATPSSTWGQYRPLSEFMEEFRIKGTGGVGGGRTAPAAAPARDAERERRAQAAAGLYAEKAKSGLEWAGTQVGAAGATPTISEYLQQHGIDPTSADPKLMGKARGLQQQWARKYMSK